LPSCEDIFKSEMHTTKAKVKVESWLHVHAISSYLSE
jgi:hypothetical protein